MRGFPKHINTKADVEFLTSDPEFSEQMQTRLAVMAQDSKKWFTIREVAEKEIIPVSDTVTVIEEKQPDGTVKKYLSELRDDPNSILERLGIEVKAEEVAEEKVVK